MSWQPTASATTLAARSRLLQTLRRFFVERDFLEVQTPVLSRDTVVDRHLDPIVVENAALDCGQSTDQWFLQTSPEFALKRLVASGMEAIFEIGPAFRAGETGPLHNPEFTMLEWYRTGDNYSAGVGLLSELTHYVLASDYGQEFQSGKQRTIEPTVSIASYQDVWLEHVGLDPLESSAAELSEWTQQNPQLGVQADWSNDKDDWLHLIFDSAVQPHLGRPPLILTDYPASQSALAQVDTEDTRVAQRFELFIDGIELANGYHELTDAPELEDRNACVNSQREQDGKPMLPAESQLLQAMRAGMPACSGCALGVDRLLMALLAFEDIAEVLTLPFDRA